MMNFERIRTAIAHYEDLRRRLTFKVRPWKDEGCKPPVTRFVLEPEYAGSPISYGIFTQEDEARRFADDYNERSRVFLAGEYDLLRKRLKEEAES